MWVGEWVELMGKCTDLGVLFRPSSENSIGLLRLFSFSIKLVITSNVPEIVDVLYKSAKALIADLLYIWFDLEVMYFQNINPILLNTLNNKGQLVIESFHDIRQETAIITSILFLFCFRRLLYMRNSLHYLVRMRSPSHRICWKYTSRCFANFDHLCYYFLSFFIFRTSSSINQRRDLVILVMIPIGLLTVPAAIGSFQTTVTTTCYTLRPIPTKIAPFWHRTDFDMFHSALA